MDILTKVVARATHDAAVAQSVERRIGSAEVTGPIPVSSSYESLEVSISRLFCCVEWKKIGNL